ncbi:MAG: hypothetical protein [Olavius algarvensis Gamma 1 endosymbiont]|nr:MAG: hypothetical protein [Olavius algarvensis Gamma 1 endosymbiont]
MVLLPGDDGGAASAGRRLRVAPRTGRPTTVSNQLPALPAREARSARRVVRGRRRRERLAEVAKGP